MLLAWLMCVETAALFEQWTYECSHFLQRHGAGKSGLGPRFNIQARVDHRRVGISPLRKGIIAYYASESILDDRRRE